MLCYFSVVVTSTRPIARMQRKLQKSWASHSPRVPIPRMLTILEKIRENRGKSENFRGKCRENRGISEEFIPWGGRTEGSIAQTIVNYDWILVRFCFCKVKTYFCVHSKAFVGLMNVKNKRENISPLSTKPSFKFCSFMFSWNIYFCKWCYELTETFNNQINNNCHSKKEYNYEE